MSLVPAPDPKNMGGERIEPITYYRFLSVCNWEPARAAPLLQKDFRWRIKYKPKLLRPSHMPNMCRQRAWIVLTKPVGRAGALWGGATASGSLWGGSTRSTESSGSSGGGSSPSGSSSGSGSLVIYSRSRSSTSHRAPLHPPHTRPPLTQWRYTRQGMPITLCVVGNWMPERVSHDERERHVAYHVRASPSPPDVSLQSP